MKEISREGKVINDKRKTNTKFAFDDFPTPRYATRALMEVLTSEYGLPLHEMCVWEPAANRGAMATTLAEKFGKVRATDVLDYKVGYPTHDFLGMKPDNQDFQAIITNPPFALATKFIVRALEYHTPVIAVLARVQLLEGITRYRKIFAANPPTEIRIFCERVSFWRGRLDPERMSLMAFAWFIWDNRIPVAERQFKVKFFPPGTIDKYTREGDFEKLPGIAPVEEN